MDLLAKYPAEYQVAFFTNTYLPHVGGVARSVHLYQQYLNRLGDDVIVYAPEYDDAAEDEGVVRRVPAIRHFNETEFSLPVPLGFKPISDFENGDFDIVHTHHPFLLGETGMQLAREHRLPLVYTYHTQYERYTHYVPVQDEVAQRTIIRHTTEFCNMCDLIIAPTSDIKRLLRSRDVTTPIQVLPTGIELARYDQPGGARVREELGIPADAPLLVHVGRLALEKNLEFLLEACLLVLADHPGAHMIVAGDGAHRHLLEKRTAEAGPAGERIHFVGRRSGQDLIDVYGAGDLFVFSSKTETQGMVILESMAAGVPAVVLEADGMSDIVRDGENGRMLPGDADERAFAEAIGAALDDPAQRALWSENARSTAAGFDMPLLARRLHELYMELKLKPNAQIKRESMSFGLIRNYFETVLEDIEEWFKRI